MKGVAFLLFAKVDNDLKLYAIKELTSKPAIFKEAGMISFPLETMEEEDDGVVERTLLRLIDEETGIPIKYIVIGDIIKKDLILIPQRKDIIFNYAYGFFIGNPQAVSIFKPKDTDIVFAGWKSVNELLKSFRRVEVEPLMAHFEKVGLYQKVFKIVE